ncbi:MAG: hypothetical protein LZF62_320136 [Nitrospira sp.]|nr:MAG: hypothetical protein LZF62_320136 [Nitrospira sp.]
MQCTHLKLDGQPFVFKKLHIRINYLEVSLLIQFR